MDYMDHIVTNIKALCALRGITVRDIERRCGIAGGAIAHWQTSSPSVRRVQRVADALGVGIDDLIADNLAERLLRERGGMR